MKALFASMFSASFASTSVVLDLEGGDRPVRWFMIFLIATSAEIGHCAISRVEVAAAQRVGEARGHPEVDRLLRVDPPAVNIAFRLLAPDRVLERCSCS